MKNNIIIHTHTYIRTRISIKINRFLCIIIIFITRGYVTTLIFRFNFSYIVKRTHDNARARYNIIDLIATPNNAEKNRVLLRFLDAVQRRGPFEKHNISNRIRRNNNDVT